MPILDQHGRPIKQQALMQPQTARVAGLYQHFAGHPSRGLTPDRLAAILVDAEQGDLAAQAELFEDMEEKDGHIFAELSKRRRALLGLDWAIQPPRNASRQEADAAAMLQEILLDMTDLDDVVLNAADAIGKGYSAQEISWQRDGRLWLPAAIDFRQTSWFTVTHDRNTLRLRDNTPAGAELQPFGWIVHRHQAKSGYLARSGLHRVLAWPYLFKNYSVGDLAEFLEIHGLPLRLGTYRTGASDQEKSTLMKAVISIGHAAAGIIPEGMQIDFKEAAKGTEAPFKFMIEWCERTQSKAILGGTLTSQTDSGSGAMALGNVHNEVRRDLLVSDARQIEKTLTRDLVYPLSALNIAGIISPRRTPRFVFDTAECEDLKLLSEAVPKLVGVGMQIPERWLHEKTRIPDPTGSEAILQAAGPQAMSAARGMVALQHDLGPDVADAYVDQLDVAAAQAMDGLMAPIRDLVMQAESMPGIRDGLIALSARMPIADFGNVLQRALAAAELAGRFEVSQGE